jgi:ribosome-associated toxin RatA of RatAB toxin-antitoxin module
MDRSSAAMRDVTDGDGTKGLEATFEVEVPPDPLLDLLWSPANFGRLFPDIEEARVVREDGARIEVAYRIDAVVRRLGYVLARTLDRERRTISWREIGGDLRRVRGGWRIEQCDREGASAVIYSAFVDVGFFIPTGLVRDAAKRKLGEMVARVQRVAAEIHAANANVKGAG